MEVQCKNIVDDMRLVAGMMRMGERIAFGRDAFLMEWAAERIEELERALSEIDAETANAHDGACIAQVRAILHTALRKSDDN